MWCRAYFDILNHLDTTH